MNKFINKNKLMIDCKVDKNAIVGGSGGDKMNDFFVYIQEESDKIMEQYEDELKDFTESQMNTVASIIKDFFKLGSKLGAEVVNKIK
jgi:hypothetical protein